MLALGESWGQRYRNYFCNFSQSLKLVQNLKVDRIKADSSLSTGFLSCISRVENLRARILLERCLSQCGCHNDARQTGGLNTRDIFLMVLEAGKSKFKILTDVFPGENSLLACRWSPSGHVLTWWAGRKGEGWLFGAFLEGHKTIRSESHPDDLI